MIWKCRNMLQYKLYIAVIYTVIISIAHLLVVIKMTHRGWLNWNKKSSNKEIIIIIIIITDKTIHLNRPDITFMNKKTKNTLLIDIAVPNTHNLAKTKTDKQNKYQELANEICAVWKGNTAHMIPIAISSTAVIPKSLSQSIKRLNLHPNTYIQMQKSVIVQL
jgi:hypothetical protein